MLLGSTNALVAGLVPVTPIRDGIASTIELLVREQRDAGRLVPELHGL